MQGDQEIAMAFIGWWYGWLQASYKLFQQCEMTCQIILISINVNCKTDPLRFSCIAT